MATKKGVKINPVKKVGTLHVRPSTTLNRGKGLILNGSIKRDKI